MILSDVTQARMIAALLGCRKTEVDPDSLTDPWAEYYDWIMGRDEDETPKDRWFDFLQVFLGRKAGHADSVAIIREIHEQPAGAYPAIGEILTSLPELQWLWESWIPRGLLSLLIAEPGVGKSYLALDLARRIAAGTEYPDGSPVGRPGNVLYVEAEHAPQVLKQRLRGWSEGELRRLFLMLPSPRRMMIDLNGNSDRDRLLDMMYQIRPELVVVDSFGAVSLKSENAKEDVQLLLSFLTQTAVDYECGMVMIHHPRKKSSAQLSLPSVPMTIHAVRGSSYLVQIARIVLSLDWVQTGPELDRNGPRRLEVIKNNLNSYPEPIGVFFEPREDDPTVAGLSYGDAPQPYRKPTKVEECMAWLVDVLEKEGPTSPSTLVEWARDEGYSRSTVYRVRKRLGDNIVDTKGHQHPDNQWSLPVENEENE